MPQVFRIINLQDRFFDEVQCPSNFH